MSSGDLPALPLLVLEMLTTAHEFGCGTEGQPSNPQTLYQPSHLLFSGYFIF